MASSCNQRQIVLSEIVATKPDSRTRRVMSGVLQLESGMPWVAGNSHAKAFTCTTSSGGKSPGATRTRPLLQTCQSFLEKALAPHADDFTPGIEAVCNPVVRKPFGSEQNHSGPHHLEIRQRILAGSATELSFFIS